MFTNIYKNIIAIFLLLLVTACGNSGSSLPGTAPGTSPGATANPSVRILGNNAKIIISFGKTVDTGSLGLGGSLAGEAQTLDWSNNRVPNDTLVISPEIGKSWVLGNSRTINISANELGGSGQIILNLVYDVYNGTGFFVSNDNGDDTANGLTPATATKTIAAAITLATTSTPAWIVVDGGNYPVTYGAAGNASHIKILTDGISLYGGYNFDFTDRDTNMYTSVISNNSSFYVGSLNAANTAIEVGNSVTPGSVIDGFTVYATTRPTQWFTSAILVNDGGAATIQNNILHGGTGQYPFGIDVAINASPIIQYNEIYGGTSVKVNSTVNGNSYGIHSYNNSNPIIRYNRISGGTGIDNSVGILAFIASTALIHNNIIGGGNAKISEGIAVVSSSPIIRNNTIYSGNGTVRSNGVTTGGINSSDPLPAPVIENNIIFTGASPSSNCILEYTMAQRPASVKNNDLFGCGNAIYWGPDPFCPNNLDGDGNAYTCSLAEMETMLGVAGSRNVSIDLTFSFLNFDGPDNNIITMDDNNWQLAASTSSIVTAGGLNGGDLGWGYLDDMTGKVRPPTGVAWSIGAYEP